MAASPKAKLAQKQFAPVRRVVMVYAPIALPEPAPGFAMASLLVVVTHNRNEDVTFTPDQLKPAIEQWVEQGYRRQRLVAVATDGLSAEAFSAWDEVRAEWTTWADQAPRWPFPGTPAEA